MVINCPTRRRSQSMRPPVPGEGDSRHRKDTYRFVPVLTAVWDLKRLAPWKPLLLLALQAECTFPQLSDAGRASWEPGHLVPSSTLTERAVAPHTSTLAWKIPWTFAFCMMRKLRLHSNLMFSISSLKFGEFFKFLAIFSFWNSSPPMMSTFLSQPLAPRSHLQSYP